MKKVRYESTWFQPDAVCRVTDRLSVVLVKGCGSGFVKRAAYRSRYGTWVRHSREIHAMVGRDVPSPFLHSLDDPDPDRHVVALWRDPVDRFAAVFGEWCRERVPHLYASYAGVQGEEDWDRLLRLTQFELGKADPAAMVEHLRPQSASWSSDTVDEVVHATDVRQVFDHWGATYRRFVSPIRRQVPRPPADVAAAVRELYAADYALRPVTSTGFTP